MKNRASPLVPAAIADATSCSRPRVWVCDCAAVVRRPGARGDVYSNIGPAPQLPAGDWWGVPLENYSLIRLPRISSADERWMPRVSRR